MGYPPWHMWGTSQAARLNTAGDTGAGPDVATHQLARVSYVRPESWNFFFGLDVLNISSQTDQFFLQCFFQLIIGVGRSQFSIGRFEFFEYTNPGGGPVASPTAKFWSTRVPSPGRLQQAGQQPLNPDICDCFTAQNIQCSARLSLFSPVPFTIETQLTAHFAPRVHVRPEWYLTGSQLDGKKFRGGEHGGM